jgi:1A family penicillin-binding protein
MSPRARDRSATPFRRFLRWSVRVCGLGLAALLLTLGYFWFSTALPAPEHLRARAALGSTRILDRRGRLLFEAPDPFAGRRRALPLREIPLALRHATIAVEDRGFYANPGVDLRGILRAAWTDLRSGAAVAGGSTITQQLTRSFLLDPDLAQRRTLERKLREAALALKLTASYPKDEILALYLNQTYYGGMAYGVEAASQRFFGKPARELDLAECALLAGLPQAPSRYDPLANPTAALARQAEVLDAMASAGYISAEQAVAAKAEPLQFVPDHGAPRAPHFVRYVLDQLDEWLGPDAVARGGLTVTTTLDADLNDAAQASLRRQLELLATPRNGGPDHRARNGAVVVLDPASGAILAMVGSPDFEDAAIQGQVNATLAWRQPGSAIKPLTYAAALERGWTPATTILDVPSSFATREGRPYTPQNYDRAYHGPLALREALATSSNVAAVRVLDSIGVPALLDIAARLGVVSLSRDSGRYGLSLTLGGGEVTPLELTAAYAAFANGGQRVTPYAIVDITDTQGHSLVDERPKTKDEEPQPAAAADEPSSFALRPWSKRQQVLAPQVAYLITDILSDRYARMRAFGESSALDIDRPAAAKTGTTSDWRDNWTVGYTPDRAVGVWVGNADGQPMEAISGVSGAGPVWHEVMLAAHRGLPPRPFAPPDGIVEVAICAEGGLLPAPDCPATHLERFVVGTQPTRRDDTHVRVAVDAALGCRAPSGYPADRTVTRVFRVLPPGAETWAIAAGLPQPPRQLCPKPTTDDRRPTTDELRSQNDRPSSTDYGPPTPALLSPAPGAVFAISPGIPRERQRIAIAVQAGGDAAKLTIYLDGQPLAALSGPPYRAFWPLAPGAHRAWVETQDEHGRIRRSAEVEFVVTQ